MATIFTRRVIAYLLDFLVVSAFMWIISFFLYGLLGPKNVYQAYQVIPFLMPVLGLLYFILCEKIASASIGKAIMKLEVKSGRFLKTDRILNNITRTTVVNAW